VDGGGLESRLASLLQNRRRLGWDVGATQVAIQRPGMRQTGGVEHGEAAIATCVAPTKPPALGGAAVAIATCVAPTKPSALGVRRSQSRLASLLQNHRRLGWDVGATQVAIQRPGMRQTGGVEHGEAAIATCVAPTGTIGARGAAAGIATCVAPTKPSELGVGRGSDASRDPAARDAANRRRRAWRGCYRDLRRSYKTAGSARGAAVAIATCVAPTKPSALGVGRRSDASRDRAARDAANRRRRAWRGCYRDLRRSYGTRQRPGRYRDLRRSYGRSSS
jgi:hypothetical protein